MAKADTCADARNNEFNHSHHLPLRNLERAGNVGKELSVMRQGMQTIHAVVGVVGVCGELPEADKTSRPRPSSGCRPRAVAGLSEAVFGRVYPDRASGADRILQIDRTQIEQVLINLIKNAKEACSRKEHPRIEVKMLPALSWQCLITVSDNGEGILPEVQDKIFCTVLHHQAFRFGHRAQFM